MRKSQTKNTTGKIILSVVFLFLGEGLFSLGLYWPFLLSLFISSGGRYGFAFLFGVLVSLVTATSLGLASLILVVGLFVFSRLRVVTPNNFWLAAGGAVVLGLVTDKVLSLSWSVYEAFANLALVFLLSRLGYFDDDLRLSAK